MLLAGDIQSAAHCRKIIETACEKLGGIDYPRQQRGAPGELQIHRGHFRRGMGADIQGQYPRDVLPDQGGGTAHEARHAIINTASINADAPNPTLLAYATTKGAIQNFTAGLAQLLAEKGIRANAVASGPIWTPLIPSTMSEEAIENFGKQVLRMKRPGQPAEPSPVWQCRHEAIGTFPDVGNKRPHLLVFARSH